MCASLKNPTIYKCLKHLNNSNKTLSTIKHCKISGSSNEPGHLKYTTYTI